MRRIMYAAIAAAAVAAVASCKAFVGENVIAYNSNVMGEFVGGDLITDGGATLHITDNPLSANLDTLKRVYAICDILNSTEGGKDNEYDARLNWLTIPLVKDMLEASRITDDDALGNDPLHVNSAWMGGGYLNMLLLGESKNGSTKPHTVNLVFNDVKSDADTLYFTLRHNANGESVAAGMSASELTLANAYASFPAIKYFPAGRDSIAIRIDWRWLEAAGTGWSSETTDYSIRGTWYKDKFVQASLKK